MLIIFLRDKIASKQCSVPKAIIEDVCSPHLTDLLCDAAAKSVAKVMEGFQGQVIARV